MKAVICSQSHITIGAGVTYSEAKQAMSGYFPHLDAFWTRIAGPQIRNIEHDRWQHRQWARPSETCRLC